MQICSLQKLAQHVIPWRRSHHNLKSVKLSLSKNTHKKSAFGA
jgi:hypothetical protein